MGSLGSVRDLALEASSVLSSGWAWDAVEPVTWPWATLILHRTEGFRSASLSSRPSSHVLERHGSAAWRNLTSRAISFLVFGQRRLRLRERGKHPNSNSESESEGDS